MPTSSSGTGGGSGGLASLSGPPVSPIDGEIGFPASSRVDLAQGRMRLAMLASLLVLGFLTTACNFGDAWGAGSGDGIASASTPLALGPDAESLWVVNPDADSVTSIDVATGTAAPSIAVGREPWSIAVTPQGLVVVANRADGTLTFLDEGRREDLRVGPEPAALALSPSGRLAYVTLSSSSEVIVVDTRSRQVSERLAVAAMPWAVAVTDDGDGDDLDETIVVTHRLALPLGGDERYGRLTLISRNGQREVHLPEFEFGFANALEGLALQGDQVYAVHQLNKPGLPRGFNTSVSAGFSRLPMTPPAGGSSLLPMSESVGSGLHLNDSSFSTPVSYPRAVALSRDGSRAYIVLGGSDSVMGVDLSEPDRPRLIGFWPVGSNPRGIVLDGSGERAFVMNYLSRDVSILDLAGSGRKEIARIESASETLSPELLAGKVLFNKANDPRISRLGWISCSSCHLDGGGDGTTWDTPEGVRQTMPLWNLEGTLPLHAAATRDEVQDFEGDLEVFMKGAGLAPGEHQPLLGAPNGGRSEELDALAAFVLRGFRTPAAPSPDGIGSSLPSSSQPLSIGRALFESSGCAGCHGGPAWTISSPPAPVGEQAEPGVETVNAVLHQVGTFDPEHDVLGEGGFDVPTLLGLHATAPYLHDGSAPRLVDVLDNELHTGVALTEGEKLELARFLLTIDDTTEPVRP